MNQTLRQPEIAIVLAAHGSSKDVRINRPMFALADRIATSGQFGTVTPAFLDGQPSVQWILDEIRQQSIIVIPFMTSCGYYTDTVLPKHLKTPSKHIRFAPPIGVHPQLGDLVCSDIHPVVQRLPVESTCIVLVGHGTRRNKKSCLTTIDLVKNLRGKLPDHNVRFAFIDQRPYVQHIVETTTDQNLIVIPFLMGLGPHSTVDVPEAFGAEKLTEQILENQSGFPLSWQAELNGTTKNVFLTRPIGTYDALGDVCITLASDMMHKEVAA